MRSNAATIDDRAIEPDGQGTAGQKGFGRSETTDSVGESVGFTRKGTLKRRPCLLLLSGIDFGRLIVLEQTDEPMTVGREKENTIWLDSPEISRQHATLTLVPGSESGSLIVRDLGSRNRTFVNNRVITEHALRPGDKVRFGPHILMKLMFQDDEDIEYQNRLFSHANNDYLTSISNRRFFIQSLEQEWSYARRHETTLSLAMLDIDHFKKLNDEYGHLVGDEVLKQFVERLKTCIRREDLLSRYGGEEFALLLRDTPRKDALLQSTRILRAIEEPDFTVGELKIPVTVSIGLATVLGDSFGDRSPKSLVELADAALYQAKNRGRNQVVSTK